MARAMYAIVEDVAGAPLVIKDTSTFHDAVPTVTNDAELVVQELVRDGRLTPGRRLLYYDTDGQLDEIELDERGHFAGFKPGPR